MLGLKLVLAQVGHGHLVEAGRSEGPFLVPHLPGKPDATPAVQSPWFLWGAHSWLVVSLVSSHALSLDNPSAWLAGLRSPVSGVRLVEARGGFAGFHRPSLGVVRQKFSFVSPKSAVLRVSL